MKNLIILLALMLFNYILAFAQTDQLDSLFTNEGNLAVNIKEVTSDGVKYTYPNEDIITTIYKNAIYKIRFKSGRVQVFSESSSFNLVTGGEDWEKVTISQVENEVKGLFKLDQVSTKAKGATIYSNMNKVKNRAYDKLKIQAALLGGNVVYLTNQNTEGNNAGSIFQSAKTTETNLSGVAYTNRRPKYQEFMDQIGNARNFKLDRVEELGNNDTELNTRVMGDKEVVFDKIFDENGNLYIMAKISNAGTDTFKVTYFDSSKIVLMWMDRKKVVNYVISAQN